MEATAGNPSNGGGVVHPTQPVGDNLQSHNPITESDQGNQNGSKPTACGDIGAAAATADCYKEPVYDRVDGTVTAHKTEYDIENKGLFVMVSNTSFKYVNDGHDWSRESTLNYDRDELSLKDAFNLADDAANLMIGYDLTSEDQHGQYEFDAFMNDLVKEKPGEPKYDFVMFTLMSHGLEDGKFLLAEEKPSKACCGSEKQKVKHSYKGQCHLRDVKTDVVRKLQDSPKFQNIPKIFLIQTCRGQEMKAHDLREAKAPVPSAAKPPEPTLADKYVPIGSDTYVLFACYEDHLCWVDGGGSFLVKNFCDVMNDLRKAVGQSEIFFAELEKRMVDDRSSRDPYLDHDSEATLARLNNYIVGSRGWDRLFLCPESLTGGWMEGIAQKTLAKITNTLITMKIIDENGVVHDTRYDKQQPQISCTLRFKLSMIKVLRTQWEDVQM